MARLVLGALAAGAVFASASAAQTETLRVQERANTAVALQATVAGAAPTLGVLLSRGYEIIHVDAPLGSQSARFILQKGAKVYSCEPAVYRSGNDSAGNTRVLSGPCLDLTP